MNKKLSVVKEPGPPVLNKLPWPAYDNHMAKEVKENFKNAMKFIARAKVLSHSGLHYNFKACIEKSKKYDDGFNPNSKEKQAQLLMTMAKILTQRTDDPKTGVGAVLVDPDKMEILAIGWNGFPRKALYGEFPRASDGDKTGPLKFPYVIHAEQNALLTRNRKDIKGAILFVTKSPCNECAPLIAMEGVAAVIVDDDVSSIMEKTEEEQQEENFLGYKKFAEMVKNEEIICYQTRPTAKNKHETEATPDTSYTRCVIL